MHSCSTNSSKVASFLQAVVGLRCVLTTEKCFLAQCGWQEPRQRYAKHKQLAQRHGSGTFCGIFQVYKKIYSNIHIYQPTFEIQIQFILIKKYIYIVPVYDRENLVYSHRQLYRKNETFTTSSCRKQTQERNACTYYIYVFSLTNFAFFLVKPVSFRFLALFSLFFAFFRFFFAFGFHFFILPVFFWGWG